jgi:hypothetical protein
VYRLPHSAEDSQVELELSEKENLELEVLQLVKNTEKKNPYQGSPTIRQTKSLGILWGN